MSLWTFMDGGISTPQRQTFGQKIALWWGYRMAIRHKHVSIPPSCAIHPDSRIHPRKDSITLGANCTVAPGAVLQGCIQMGHSCSVQVYSVLVGYGEKGKITIGNHVRIAPHVMMIAANHIFTDTSHPIAEQGLDAKPITIEDDVWIAGRVNIMAGVTIGRGSVIGAGSIVTHDIPPYSIAVGVPAKVIRNRLYNIGAAQ